MSQEDAPKANKDLFDRLPEGMATGEYPMESRDKPEGDEERRATGLG